MIATYNPTTDKIEGCEKGTYTYEHELRHREQYKNGSAIFTDRLHIVLYYLAFLNMPFGYMIAGWTGVFLSVGVFMLPHILSLLYLELDASIVGFVRWRKRMYDTNSVEE